MLLGYNVAKAPASPRNSTWFTTLFLLVRGWGLGTRLAHCTHTHMQATPTTHALTYSHMPFTCTPCAHHTHTHASHTHYTCTHSHMPFTCTPCAHHTHAHAHVHNDMVCTPPPSTPHTHTYIHMHTTQKNTHVFPRMQEGQGATQTSRGGQASMKSILENMPELWSEEQYTSEYDLSSFMQSLGAANKN